MTIAEHQFNGLLNADDTPELVAPNEYVALSNMRIGVSRSGKYNLLQLIEGTQAIETNALPSTGTNKCRGNHLNPFTNEIIFFVWNSLGEHGIYLLSTDSTVTKIAEDADFETGLGLTEDYWVHNIDTVGDLLYWAIPGRNPCRINYRRLIDAEFTLPMAEPVYTLIRKPPAYPVTATKVVAADLTPPIVLLSNQVDDKAYRIALQYIYKDNEESTLSPHSKVVSYNVDAAPEDILEIKVPLTEKIAEDVKQLRLIAITLPDETYNEIKVWDTVTDVSEISDHNDGTTALTYYYAADKIGPAIDKVQAVKPFDNVPRETGTHEIAKDRLFLSDNLIGYDTPGTTSLDISITSADAGPLEDVMVAGTYYFTYTTADGETIELPLPYQPTLTGFTVDVTDKQFTLTGADIISGELRFNLAGSYAKDRVSPFILTMFIDGISVAETQFGNINTGSDTSYLGFTHEFSAPIDINTGQVLTFEIRQESGTASWNLILASPTTISIGRRTVSLSSEPNSLKSNMPYGAGNVFYDKWLRQCGVVTNNERLITAARNAYGNAGIDPQLVAWTLSNANALTEIPEWAAYYMPVMTKAPGSFLQHYADEIRYVPSKDSGIADFSPTYQSYTPTTYAIAISLKELYATGYGYQFSEGDIVYAWFETGTASFVAEAIGQIGEYILVKPTDMGAFSSTRYCIYEIRTPAQQTDFYYETGTLYKINNPGTDIRAYSVTGGILPGDVYLLSQTFDSAARTYEAMSPSVKNWKRWITNAGRAQVVDPIGETYKPTGICFSNVYLYGSKNNGLSSFEVLNQDQLPLSLSRVRKLILTNKPQEEGTVLMAMGEAGRDTVSIYIGEAELNDVNGQVFLAKSNNVIGQVNALRGNYGTNHPESVGQEAGLLIWLDVAKGTVVQYASNGLQPVGRNKADSFWRKWCKRYIATGSTEPIPACIDVVTEQYLIKTPWLSDEPCKTGDFYSEAERMTCYQIGESKWSNASNIPAEAILVRDNLLISWYKGKPHTHDGTNYCWIYDRHVTPSITLAVNGGNQYSTKLYNWIELICQARPVKVVMEVTYPDLQHTELYAANFETIEGKQYADIMCDMWTPGMAAGTAVFDGREMRGRVMLLTINWAGGEGRRVDLAGAFIGLQESVGHTV
jgi:hypothetical protein